MRKDEFMQRLELELYRFGYEEKNEVLQDIEDHFTAGILEGRTEEEICSQLGEPEQIARQYAEDGGSFPPVQPPDNKTPTNYRILAGLGLILFDIFIGIYIIITAFSILFALSVSAIVIAFSGGAVMITGLISIAAIATLPGGLFSSFAMLFGGAGLLCGGVLACIGCYKLVRLSWKGLRMFVLWHGKIMQGV